MSVGGGAKCDVCGQEAFVRSYGDPVMGLLPQGWVRVGISPGPEVTGVTADGGEFCCELCAINFLQAHMDGDES